MHLALAEQQHLMRIGAMIQRQRGVLLHQLGERRRHLHLVLAVFQHETGAEHRLRPLRSLHLDDAALLARHGLARVTLLQPAKGDRITSFRSAALHRILALHGEDAGDAFFRAGGRR